jgi:hypothetical protein
VHSAYMGTKGEARAGGVPVTNGKGRDRRSEEVHFTKQVHFTEQVQRRVPRGEARAVGGADGSQREWTEEDQVVHVLYRACQCVPYSASQCLPTKGPTSSCVSQVPRGPHVAALSPPHVVAALPTGATTVPGAVPTTTSLRCQQVPSGADRAGGCPSTPCRAVGFHPALPTRAVGSTLCQRSRSAGGVGRDFLARPGGGVWTGSEGEGPRREVGGR